MMMKIDELSKISDYIDNSQSYLAPTSPRRQIKALKSQRYHGYGPSGGPIMQ